MAAPLAIEGLRVVRDRRAVLAGVSLSAGAGEVLALIGPNGAGKTTLLAAVIGRLAYEGSIRLGADDAVALPARERARRVAYVPQRSGLRAAMRVANVVASGRYARQGWLARLSATDADAVQRAMALADCAALAERSFDRLSCGEQQRVLLARALATDAPLLLLDEPTAGLDPRHALALLALLRRLAAEGRAVVVVLHHLDEVERCADRAVLLAAGAVLAAGAPAEVLAEAPLRAAYGIVPVPNGALGLRLAEG